MESFSPVFVDSYDPLKAGSIDGTDEYPHDRAISRALQSNYRPNKYVKGDPERTIFVGRLSPHTTEDSLKMCLKQFGTIINVRLVRDIVTGFSKCYAFIEFEDKYQARNCVRSGHPCMVDDHNVLLEMEKERILKGWIPRRFGGGLGGKRESGQLRFGGRDRPFRKPIIRADLDSVTGSEKKNFRNENFTNEKARSRHNDSKERYTNRRR
ncbi:U11/U12 small nuclear ribonucleoprotein 35 kDa protein-like [Physella acuta]|uniref:U11/U12 small nuclear ribonucleoprotein 35 kDa protein-like n=1 Tax=Physella acuta TaxID=109671 RepID=UPI0027DE0DCA|nr:U11/U12 small nuclear ribonucleoprotein 35 kDa protein-like [Physella acuta]